MTFSVFSSLNNDRTIQLLTAPKTADDITLALGDIYRLGFVSPAEYILHKAISDDNLYYRQAAMGTADKFLEENFRYEARALGDLADKTKQDYQKSLESGRVPSFPDNDCDVYTEILSHAENIATRGWGIFSVSRMFELDESLNIIPVVNPDEISLEELIDYDREQTIVMNNTLALLEGKPAQNILLTGDAGTGKSSTVKAVANKLSDRGLRIIQISKDQLCCLKSLLADLSQNPLKFILFIDDLSFRHDDDNSRALKAVLEGSVSAKSGNVVIYATSNRRHIVRESLKEREQDEVHRNDAMQETLSLSERFGIHISFSRPDKKTYLAIVKGIADQAGLSYTEEELYAGAERFALERGLRSARCAKQYVDSLMAN